MIVEYAELFNDLVFVLFSNAEIVAENCIDENGESLEREKYFGDDEVELYCGFIPNQSNFESCRGLDLRLVSWSRLTV